MLELKNLNKIYNNKNNIKVHALKNVNLKLDDTGMVFITGPSGGGKSTLLNIIGGLDGFDSGNMLVKGVDSKQLNEKAFDSYRNTYVGFIFQEYNLLDYLTLAENVALAVELQEKKPTRSEIEAVFKKLNLAGLEDRFPNEISGGQRQRVAIARVLIKKPAILFADEPSGSVDKVTRKIIFDILKELSKEILIVAVTHNGDIAEKYADRIINIEDGIITNDELFADKSQTKVFNNELLFIEPGKKLTSTEVDEINKVLARDNDKGIYLTVESSSKKVEENHKKAFEMFKKSKDEIKPTAKKEVKSSAIQEPFKLVKAKLPTKVAVKLSKTNFGANKFRTAFTIILSIVAICLFSISTILAGFSTSKANIQTFLNSSMPYINIVSNDEMFTNQSIEKFKSAAKTDMSISDMLAIKKFGSSMLANGETVDGAYIPTSATTPVAVINKVVGYNHIGKNQSGEENTFGQKLLAGAFATDGNEITVSDYVAYTMLQGKSISGLTSIEDLVGKRINIKLSNNQVVYDVRIAGIYETNLNSFYSYDATANKLELKNLLDIEKQNLKVYKENVFPVIYVSNSADSFKNFVAGSETSSDFFASGITINATEHLMNGYKIISNVNVPDNTVYYKGSFSADVYKYLNVAKNNNTIFTKTFTSSEAKAALENTIELSPTDYSEIVDAVVFPTESIALSRDLTQKQLLKIANTFPELEMISSNSARIAEFGHRFGVVSKGFLTASIILALFAVVLLYSFISQSLRSKRKNIGILRAIGAGMKDVTKIFVLEALILSLSIVFGSIAITGITTLIANAVIQSTLLYGLTVFSFNFATMAIMSSIIIVVTFASYLIPMAMLNTEKPIDMIERKIIG